MNKRTDTDRPTANPSYANHQLAKALVSAEESPDPDVRERARARAERWCQVFRNIVEGQVDYGSRTPLRDVPVWATPEVVTGGFVTGALLAGGPLLTHEEQLLEAVDDGTSTPDARRALNSWFLSEDGLAQLQRMLRSGRYIVGVPEEGALPLPRHWR